MDWTVETVSAVDAEMAALPVALQARLLRLLETVENVGLEALLATARERMRQVMT